MGYYFTTKGQLYGLDYLLTGHDYFGEFIDKALGADPTTMDAEQYQGLLDQAQFVQDGICVLIFMVAIVGLMILIKKPTKGRRA